MRKKLTEFIFFGNYFYALCTVALSMEASLQQGVPLNTPAYYVLLVTGTLVYYTYAYMGELHLLNVFNKLVGRPRTSMTTNSYYNRRTDWYTRNYKLITLTQFFYTLIAIAAALYLVIKEFHEIFSLHADEWLMLLAVPLVAFFYYGNDYFPIIKINLRNSGWLKPFIIGFVWAGAVTIYPVMFYKWQINQHYEISVMSVWLLIKNWMYISVLCIMFDIKDYADDYNKHLKTFVVRVGLRKTIFRILLPLIAIGLIALWGFATTQHFSWPRTLINTLPFICLLAVAYSMHRRKPILFYLIVIDGLMLLKGISGILGYLLFRENAYF
ncbi:UbiA prenyltransferase family protein [Arachidicoccus rhizosphaerae]|uniref:UbiA prenyltransferase family protein n=1 Tax=Arachidicoccus rhizosphaerae TaxID=551991 RepID=A0A1H4B916_9BACT|nr:hypothetical protein [Arachidicoccus rhizosphaerae]SEA44617.1 UbiA prenyltransferase family protein [Arachidicoccus rhizosphaerae]